MIWRMRLRSKWLNSTSAPEDSVIFSECQTGYGTAVSPADAKNNILIYRQEYNL